VLQSNAQPGVCCAWIGLMLCCVLLALSKTIRVHVEAPCSLVLPHSPVTPATSSSAEAQRARLAGAAGSGRVCDGAAVPAAAAGAPAAAAAGAARRQAFPRPHAAGPHPVIPQAVLQPLAGERWLCGLRVVIPGPQCAGSLQGASRQALSMMALGCMLPRKHSLLATFGTQATCALWRCIRLGPWT
jgi:hypothetical protein